MTAYAMQSGLRILLNLSLSATVHHLPVQSIRNSYSDVAWTMLLPAGRTRGLVTNAGTGAPFAVSVGMEDMQPAISTNSAYMILQALAQYELVLSGRDGVDLQW
jgi:hypothetical protein